MPVAPGTAPGMIGRVRNSTERRSTTERLFRVAIAMKGLDGGLQLLAGIVLIFLPAAAITRLADTVVNRELVGDPTGKLAVHLHAAADHFAGGSRSFAITYLLLHGIIKIVLVAALWRKLMAAYPIAVAALGAFVVYEVLRAIHTRSIALPIFAALDLVIIFLVVKEYLQLRRERRLGVKSKPSSETVSPSPPAHQGS
ncbi:MAG: DUF2127 domain-containing protein [Pseudonocardiaceae bacterium]